MKNYYDKTWKIGELAKAFNVNVQLLRHYDKEGLLVPDIRNPNNKWRTYRYDQIYSLGMIRFLRVLDCSLDDIRDFMKGRNAESTEAFLNEKIEEAKEKYESLLHMESVIKDRFALIGSEMPYSDSDQVFVFSEGEIYYIETRGLEAELADKLFYLYQTIVLYKGNESTFAVRIDPDYSGEYSDRVRVIPPADYLVGFHRGSYDNIYDTFERIKQSADSLLEEGEEVSDEVITLNIIDQLVEEDRDRFVTKVMMQIRH